MDVLTPRHWNEFGTVAQGIIVQGTGGMFSYVSLTPPVKEITTTVTRHILSFDL